MIFYCIFETKKMSLKYQNTTADFLPWESFEKFLLLLERDKEYNFLLLVSTGVFFALRISDILSLKWKDILNKKEIMIVEKKTKKKRTIPILSKHQNIIYRCYKHKNEPYLEDFIIISRKGQPMSIQYVNRRLKAFKEKYNLPIKNFSSHSLRKTFGRHVWENSNYSEKSLLLLSDLFGHSSPAYTKRYLGIREEEIENLYKLLN